MKLSDYEWSGNPRGMHNNGDVDIGLVLQQGFGMIKIVALGAEYVSLAAELRDRNITPIIRIYRGAFSGRPVDAELETQFRQYLQAGIKWFELYNEPNLAVEWPPNANFDPMNIPEVIAPICDNWLNWAEMVADYGAYPGFLALSDANGFWESTLTWINQTCLYMFDHHYKRFLDILANGFWLPTHPYVLNHFYQEVAGGPPTAPRPPETQLFWEGGWHFEYPYDPISQMHDPGRSVWGGTPLSPIGDVNGLLGSGLAWMQRLQEIFGIGAVPVIGTEGGLWPMPEPNVVQQVDNRYPGFTIYSHAHATMAMFDWIIDKAPPWMFGLTLWRWNDYYQRPEPQPPFLPVTDFFRDVPPRTKSVPPIEVLSDYDLTLDGEVAPYEPPPIEVIIEPPGPGPIHGQADYHFIVLAPGIDQDWFFVKARAYWERFKPTLMTIMDFINFLPKQRSLAVTVITTPEAVDLMNDQIARRWANVYMDMVVATDGREVEEQLNSRVAAGRRFG